MPCEIENAIKVEKQPRKSGGPRTVYVFECRAEKCKNTLKVRAGKELKTREEYCSSCSHRKRPFESLYNGLFNDHRNIKVELTYEEFLEFTKIDKCSYCLSHIPWTEYSISKGNYISRAYFLDRKNPWGPYSKENCVVCCSECNKMKRDLTHDEFIAKCGLIWDVYSSKLF